MGSWGWLDWMAARLFVQSNQIPELSVCFVCCDGFMEGLVTHFGVVLLPLADMAVDNVWTVVANCASSGCMAATGTGHSKKMA